MSKLVTFAVPEEAAPFRRRKRTDMQVIVTGMGAEAARRGFIDAIENDQPELVVTSGFCGGLNPSLERGMVVVDRESEADLLTIAETGGLLPVRVSCANRVAVSAHEKEMLFRRSDCDVVEMESGVIMQICRERGIPVATIRVISDTATEDLPLDFNKLTTSTGTVHFGRLAIEVAKRPKVIPQLIKLQKHTKAAAERLADALDSFFAACR
jgi:adenosylhomocysteine nucleosidase